MTNFCFILLQDVYKRQPSNYSWSLYTYIFVVESVITLESVTLIKDNLISYNPASENVAVTGVIFVNVPPTAKPFSGPQYPTCAISISCPAESVAINFGIAGPETSTSTLTLERAGALSPINFTSAFIGTDVYKRQT